MENSHDRSMRTAMEDIAKSMKRSTKAIEDIRDMLMSLMPKHEVTEENEGAGSDD